MHTDAEILAVLKNATRIDVPRGNDKICLQKKGNIWFIVSWHGPGWYWNKKDGWIISLTNGADKKMTTFLSVVEAFNTAKSLPSIEEQRAERLNMDIDKCN